MSYFIDDDVEVYLKVLRDEEDEYDRRLCAVADCPNPSSVLDGTRRLASCAVPLCELHWEQWCEAEEAVAGSFTVQPNLWV